MVEFSLCAFFKWCLFNYVSDDQSIYWVPIVITVHNDIDASIKKKGEEFELALYSYREFGWLKNDVQYK